MLHVQLCFFVTAWLKNCHTFSCKKPSLIWQNVFGPLVTVLMGFHCNCKPWWSTSIFCWSCRFVTLSPGDVVITGTPPGVGVFRKPPVFLKVCTLSLVSFCQWQESCGLLFNCCRTYSYEEQESGFSSKNGIITWHVKQRLGNCSLLIR